MRKEAFEQIYSTHAWGGESRSGPGSDPANTKEYVRFLSDWLTSRPDCQSIVELGCGDWATTSLVSLGERAYLGVDIVNDVVKRNQERYGAKNRQFVSLDFIATPPPRADLLIVKDVLQHLSNATVCSFLREVLPRYNYAILVNDVSKFRVKSVWRFFKRKELLQPANSDAPDGGTRPLRLDEAPFCLPIMQKQRYSVTLQTSPERIIYEKDILVWQNRSSVRA